MSLCKIARCVVALVGGGYGIECSGLEVLPTELSSSFYGVSTKLVDVQQNEGKRIVTIQITLPEEEEFSDSTNSSEDKFLTEITAGVQHLIEASMETKKMEQLQDKMVGVIAGDAGITALFPQREEDLEKVDDVKRNQFMSLVQWVLKVFKPEVADYLKDKITELDRKFVKLVEDSWGNGIYESFDGTLMPLGDYEIPSDIFGGLEVGSILSINPDIISDSIYNAFQKLIHIINMVSPYASSEATSCLTQLKTDIRETVNVKFSDKAIMSYLADHSQTDIVKSIKHYKKWIQLAAEGLS